MRQLLTPLVPKLVLSPPLCWTKREKAMSSSEQTTTTQMTRTRRKLRKGPKSRGLNAPVRRMTRTPLSIADWSGVVGTLPEILLPPLW